MGVVYSLIWIGVFAGLGFGSYWFIQRQERTRGQQPLPTAPADERPTLHQSAPAAPADDGPPVALPIELWIKLVDRVAHLAILGPTDSGKTTLAEAVLRMLLERGVDRKTVIIDPKWKQQSPPKWGGLPAAMLDEVGGYTAVERVLLALLDEFRARVKRLQQGQPLGDDIIIIWDEINDTMEEIGKMAGQILRRGLRIWREYRLKLIIFPQSDLVEALGLSGHGDARQNLLWIYLMEAALEKARELERQKVVDATFVHVLMQQERPAIMVWMKRAFIIDTSAALALAAVPIAPERAWQSAATSTTDAQSLRPVAAAVSSVAITQTANDDPFHNVDFLPLARLVKAKMITETKCLETAFDVRAGSGQRYLQARDRLKTALAQLDDHPPASPATSLRTTPATLGS